MDKKINKNFKKLRNVILIFAIFSATLWGISYIKEKPKEVSSDYDWQFDNEETSKTTPTESTTTTPTPVASTPPMKNEVTSCSNSGNYFTVEGYVTNLSNRVLSFIKIRGDFTDENFNVQDTDYTYAIGSEGLAPNSKKSYDIMVPYNQSITKCKTVIVDYK